MWLAPLKQTPVPPQTHGIRSQIFFNTNHSANQTKKKKKKNKTKKKTKQNKKNKWKIHHDNNTPTTTVGKNPQKIKEKFTSNFKTYRKSNPLPS